MRIGSLLATAAIAVTATAAHAGSYGSYEAAHLAVKNMTYTTAAGVAAARTNGYSGVGSIFVSTQSTATTGFGYLCTASLVNSTTLLTAAHCIYDYNEDGERDPVTGITFYAPSFGERNSPTVVTFDASSWAYNPLYDNADHTGDITSGHDVGLITLGAAADGYDTYGFYSGDPLQQFLEVGTGTTGGPAGTNQNGIVSDFEKRTGTNLYELYGDDLFSDVSHGVVLGDFDDGTASHDVFGRNLGLIQRGVTGESNSSPGDSGGPEFIDGRIVSVTSFGITGGIFQGFCGSTSTDPYNANGSTARTNNLANCTNSSVGEIFGNTLVSYNLDFINAYLAGAAVPEPASWAMMIGGLGLVGGSLRRRRHSVFYAA